MGRVLSGLVIVFHAVRRRHQAGAGACRHGNDGQDRLWFERNSGAKPRSHDACLHHSLRDPPTSILGAILLTGYLGGAMASHLRIGSPLFSHILFGFYLGLMVWGGLWLRDRSLRGVMPLRR